MKDNKERLSTLYWFSFSLGLGWIVYLCLNSPGVPVQDEIGHFLISKHAWKHPEHMLNLWGRPVRTILYMIPSFWGLNTARYFSIFLASLTVLIATKVAQKLGVKSLFLIPVFLWFQPWFNNLSYAVITQVPFSVLLITGVYLWLDDKEEIASIPIGLLPLARHEGIALTLAWFAYCSCKRKWVAAVVSVVPLTVFNIIYYFVYQSLALQIYFSPKPITLYGSGAWFHFIRPVADNVGALLLLLSLLAIVPILKLKEKSYIFAAYVLYFLVHTFIYRFGLYASGGYDIFLLPLAPAFAITAALGAEFISSLSGKILANTTGSTLSNAISRLLIAFVVVSVAYVGLRTKPRPLDYEGAALKQAADWLRSSNLVASKVVSTHVWFFYFYDLDLEPNKLWALPPDLDELPTGSIVVWDRHYSNRWGLSYDELSDPPNNWVKLKSFGDNFAVVFRKLI
jgi:hypothetical protein